MKIDSVYPGIFMKKGIFFWMGSLGMGFFLMLLVVLCVGLVILPGLSQIAVGANINEGQTSRARAQDFEEPDTWYIYTTKEIVENISFELPIVINSSGELRIKNSAWLELIQNHNYERNITIKDNGTLRLTKGILSSNHALRIQLKDKGKLILDKNSILKITRLDTKDNTQIHIIKSTLTPGAGGLFIDIGGESSLELNEGTIVNADIIKAHENSELVLNNCDIDAKDFAIECKKVSLVSNPDLRDLMIDSCDELSITNSKVSSLRVTKCTNLYSSYNTTIINSEITNLEYGWLSFAEIQNLKFDKINDLEINGCNVNILKINKMVINLKIIKSEISQLDIKSCQKLETYGTHFDNSELESSLDLVEFHSSTVEHCSMFPLQVKIFDSIIIGNTEELNDLTRGTRLDAYNSSFNAPLHFTGTSEAHIINCSTNGNIPPQVIIDEDAKINIYWWLDVQVLDNTSKPLPGATVTVCDFITNAPIKSGISDSYGQVSFYLQANTITKNGWKTRNNKSYFVTGTYDGRKASNETGIWLKDNIKTYLDFTEVKEKKKEPKPFFTFETIIGIIIFIIILVLVVISLAGGRKKPEPPPRARDHGSRRRRGTIDLDDRDRLDDTGKGNGFRRVPEFPNGRPRSYGRRRGPTRPRSTMPPPRKPPENKITLNKRLK